MKLRWQIRLFIVIIILLSVVYVPYYLPIIIFGKSNFKSVGDTWGCGLTIMCITLAIVFIFRLSWNYVRYGEVDL